MSIPQSALERKHSADLEANNYFYEKTDTKKEDLKTKTKTKQKKKKNTTWRINNIYILSFLLYRHIHSKEAGRSSEIHQHCHVFDQKMCSAVNWTTRAHRRVHRRCTLPFSSKGVVVLLVETTTPPPTNLRLLCSYLLPPPPIQSS